MYENKKILALIPARGGSKGIKNKNITDLCGKPLISYTIEAGKQSSYIDDVVVTTDSQAIATVAKQYGANVPFLRPAELASDTSKSIDAVLHAIRTLSDMGNDFDLLILLQPTSPLRTASDIDHAIETFFKQKAESLVSVSPVSDSPVLIRQIADNGQLSKILSCNSTVRRQDMKPFYVVNGSIYINYVSDITESTSFNDNLYGYIMNADHSVDIDEPNDLLYAELIMKSQQD